MIITVKVQKCKPMDIPARKAGAMVKDGQDIKWTDRDAYTGFRILGEIGGRCVLMFDLPEGSNKPDIGDILDLEMSDEFAGTVNFVSSTALKVKKVDESF